MKAISTVRILGAGLLLFSTVASQAYTSKSLNIGLSYNKGERGYGPIYSPAFGVPAFGYGGGVASLGAIGSACGILPPPGLCGGACGGGAMGPGAMFPSMPNFPMPVSNVPVQMPMAQAPIMAPHMMGGWGNGFPSFGHPGLAPGLCGLPCGSGLMPMQMGAVAGGPALGMDMGLGLSGGLSGGSSSDGDSGYRELAGGAIIEVGARNEWEKSDTGDIVWATAMGLGMQTTNVFPVMPPRYAPTVLPNFYATGDRNIGTVTRPHGAP